MTSLLALAALVILFAVLVRYAHNDRFSTRPFFQDRLRDSEGSTQAPSTRSV